MAKKIVKKEVKKIVPKVVVKAPKQEKLIATRNVEKMEALGWKKKELKNDKHGRILGVRSEINDLVLMEK